LRDLRAASGPEELVPAAMDAVKKWRYQPYEVKGQIVEVDTDIRIVFKLGPTAD
jgi:outer membrane biosynthesis protein TonB